jgi:hypothetical protein
MPMARPKEALFKKRLASFGKFEVWYKPKFRQGGGSPRPGLNK